MQSIKYTFTENEVIPPVNQETLSKLDTLLKNNDDLNKHLSDFYKVSHEFSKFKNSEEKLQTTQVVEPSNAPQLSNHEIHSSPHSMYPNESVQSETSVVDNNTLRTNKTSTSTDNEGSIVIFILVAFVAWYLFKK